MQLTKKQELGLKIAVERYRLGEPYTCIAGYAGSGKSTLIKFIIEALHLNPEEDVCYIAYTGKAANVLRQKECPNAITAHKLLYWAAPNSNGGFIFKPKAKLDGYFKVIVVDEISMLPKEMWELLLRHHIYILAAGDPEQIPPINPDTDNHVLDKPHIFLDEIMRQAMDSEIIRLSMWVREGKPIELFPCSNQEVKIVDKHEIVSGMYSWADQILCATNAKRIEINNFVREQKGYGIEPQVGDKIISLTNHWKYLSRSGDWALTNGCIGEITNFNIQQFKMPLYITKQPVSYMFTDILLEDGDVFDATPIDYEMLKTGMCPLTPRQIYQINKNERCPDAPYDFTYAYGITTHKGQGSEWNKVLLFEEGFPFDAETHRRHLYTGITRASEKLVVVKH